MRQLLDAAGGPLFDHTVAQLRSARASAQAYAEAVARYREQGYTVLDEGPRKPWGDTSFVPLRHLVTAEGAEPTQAAITNPAHWAVLLDEDTGWADRDNGELVDEETIDWSTEGDPDATPNEGMRHADSVVETTVFEPEWYCTDYAAAGLELTGIYKRNAERSDAPDTDGSSADAETARLQREAEQAEQAEQAEVAKRERRKVLALNKLGAAAATVRREFLTRLLARKTPPKGAAVFVADCLARDKGLLNEYHADEVAAELLGVSDTNALRKQAKGLGAGGDDRAQVITRRSCWVRAKTAYVLLNAVRVGCESGPGGLLRWRRSPRLISLPGCWTLAAISAASGASRPSGHSQYTCVRAASAARTRSR